MLNNASCLTINPVPGATTGTAAFATMMTIITTTTGTPGESG